jgi:hypothetical protein
MQMIRAHTGQQLDTWLGEVEESHLPELESFARGIQQDKAAVLAGLTLPWSQGPCWMYSLAPLFTRADENGLVQLGGITQPRRGPR